MNGERVMDAMAALTMAQKDDVPLRVVELLEAIATEPIGSKEDEVMLMVLYAAISGALVHSSTIRAKYGKRVVQASATAVRRAIERENSPKS